MGAVLLAQQRRIDRLEAMMAERPAATPAVDRPSSYGAGSETTQPPIMAARAEEAPPAAPSLHRTAPIAGAAPTPPPVQASVPPDVLARHPEVRAFADTHPLDARGWKTLERLNEWWVESLRKAEADGESSLPDKLAFMAEQRRIKLASVLGEDGARDWEALERSLGEHVTVRGKDGNTYEGASLEQAAVRGPLTNSVASI